jgi:hypothetical protein
MNEFRFFSLLRDKIFSASSAKEFKLYMLNFAEAPYKWGKEGIAGTDCSGLVCGPLMYMGYNVRVTADDLYKKACDKTSEIADPEKVHLVFFVDKKDRATHVGVFVSPNVIMHASGARDVTFDSLDDLMAEYEDKGEKAEFRILNFDKVYEMNGQVNGKDEDYV